MARTDELTFGLITRGGPLPPDLLAALTQRVCADPADSGGRYQLLNHHRDLAPDLARALVDSYTGDYAGLHALGLLRLHPAAELIALLATQEPSPESAQLAAQVALLADHPELLAHLAGDAREEVAVAAATNAACPVPAALAVLDRLCRPGASRDYDAQVVRLVRTRGPAWVAALVAHTDDPVVLALLAERDDLDAPCGRALARAWLIPAVAGLTGERGTDEERALGRASVRLLRHLDPPTRAALERAWADGPARGSGHQAWLRALLEAGHRPVTSVPVAELIRGARDLPPAVLAAVVAAAAPVCPDRAAWATLLRLAPDFTGTLGELLAVTAATLAGPGPA